MILAIILLVFALLLFAFLIIFTYMVLFPSLKNNTKMEMTDTIISVEERNYIKPDKIDFKITDKRAWVMCSCNRKFTNQQNTFNERYTCYMVKSLQDSGVDCKYACIGLGDCVKVCPQEAISIINNTACISDLCCGCGKCVDICPQNIIQMLPKSTKTTVTCMNNNDDELTSCSERHKENNVEWNSKKDFKIWSTCYKMFKYIKNLLSKIKFVK